ncbi:MAG: aldehyde dehydrogenase family protein [Pseudomonadota bacterium]
MTDTDGFSEISRVRRKLAAVEISRFDACWFVDGGFVSSGGEPIDVIDPATAALIGRTVECTSEEIDLAVAAAARAQPAWGEMDGLDRGRALTACADALDAIQETLAAIVALETGKAHRTECLGEAQMIASIFRYFGGLGMELKGRTIPFRNSVIAMTTREPVGVVAGIVPWNMPLMFLGYKIAAPLLAGNGVVIKAPEIAPFAVLRVIEAIRTHLPDGLINVVVGKGKNAGQKLIAHDGISKISFTGSVSSGKQVYETAARSLKQVTLELGGKSPMIMLDDCDLETVMEGAVGGMRFTRQGQSCTSSTRMFVPSGMFDAFVDGLLDKAGKLVIGDPLCDRTDSGPIVSGDQLVRVKGFVERALGEGQRFATAGELPSEPPFDQGAFMQPHVFIDPDHDAEISQRELFGPVVCVYGYDDLDELVATANDTRYGLSASIWGKDINRCLKLSRAMRAGFVQINQNAVMLPGLSYAGVKESGIGCESSLEAMLATFTEEKTTIVNLG